MKYILNEPWCLRGWKNKPYCLCDFTSPAEPLEISEADKDFLSSSFEYDGGNQTIDRMIDGALRPAGEGETLDETRQYRNYGCLHCSVNAPESPLGEFSFEKIEELLDEMKDCGLKNIVLIGGEPLVRRDFMQIVDAILHRGEKERTENMIMLDRLMSMR